MHLCTSAIPWPGLQPLTIWDLSEDVGESILAPSSQAIPRDLTGTRIHAMGL